MKQTLKHSTHQKAIPYVRAKLAISSPVDRYEQEADAMAERVMRMPAGGVMLRPMAGMIAGSIQRKCAECEEEEEKKKKGMVMRKGEGSGLQAPAGLPAQLDRSRGGGRPLPNGTRSFMEGAFSADFSRVRVHTGGEAGAMSRDIRAKAFTYGNDIYFRTGQYEPESMEGKKLLAHELTHVVQQGTSGKLQRDTEPGTEYPGELWNKVHDKFSDLVVGMAIINNELDTVTRTELGDEITAVVQLRKPGEQSDDELNTLLSILDAYQRRVGKMNKDAHDEWEDLIKRYNKEVDRLSPLIDEPVSVKAIEILRIKFRETVKRVVLAGNFLVSEDLSGLTYMLDNDKHIEQATVRIKYAKPPVAVEGSIDEDEESKIPGAVGHVSDFVGDTMTSEAGLREVYSKSAREITVNALRDVENGVTVERAARWAHQARNDLKIATRAKGSAIVKALAEARNIRKYGDKIGPTFEELIKEGKSPLDIIGSAGKASSKVNRATSRMKVGGRFFIVIDLAIGTWEVFSAPEGKRLRKALGVTGGFVAGRVMAEAGVEVGAEAGSIFGPFGAAAGGIIGGVGGAILGGILGEGGVEAVYDVVDELTETESDWDKHTDMVDSVEDDYIRAHAKIKGDDK